MTGYHEFEFDLPGALLENLVRALDQLGEGKLTAAGLAPVEETQGIYQIFLDGQLVYIGKTDGTTGLKGRLLRHISKLQHRVGLNPSRVSFKAVRIFVFTAIDLEAQLIKHYGGVSAVAWNGSGFGSNDPGRRRDATEVRDTNYDAIFPIDIDRDLDFDATGVTTVAGALAQLKLSLPYILRFEANAGGGGAHQDLQLAPFVVPKKNPFSAREIIEHLATLLPSGWQFTVLKSHIIIYKENRTYTAAQFTRRT